MGTVLDNICRDNQNIHFMFSKFFPENRAVHEIMSINVVEPERPQIIRRRVACWKTRVTRVQAHARACAPTPTHAHHLRVQRRINV